MYAGRVHFLPKTVDRTLLPGGVAVVIDLLRATTTLCHALAAGATDVRPCQDIEIAKRLAEEIGRTQCLLGGERRGVKIEGFDFGNSPSEYTSGRVAGKILLFSTTNGTRAIDAVVAADFIVLASLVNLTAVCNWLAAHPAGLDIVCAGTDGCLTREDVLTAGAIVAQLSAANVAPQWTWNEEALIARDAWRGVWSHDRSHDALMAALRASRGGANLVELGYDADIEAAARVDALNVVPLAGESLHFTDANKSPA
jgi:2-phosphosulfolactate phosphatase